MSIVEAEKERGLDHFKFKHKRSSVGIVNEINARIEPTRRGAPQCGRGDIQLFRARLSSRDLLAQEQAALEDLLGLVQWQQCCLADCMREAILDEDHCGLGTDIHTVEVWLNHGGSIVIVQ